MICGNVPTCFAPPQAAKRCSIHDGAFVRDSQSFGRYCVGLLIAAIVGVIALSGWLLWPEWRKFLAVRELTREFKQLISNCGHKSELSRNEYDAAIARGREIDKVHAAALATDFLTSMLKDDCARVRMIAAVFLEQIGPAASDAVPNLIEALRDDNAKVRLRAAYALAEFGAVASAAVPPLLDAVQDESEMVRNAAAVAARRIDPKSAARFAIENGDDRHLSPIVLDILLHYDHEEMLRGKALAF